ncbi:MAG: N-acetylneuraminate synthase family protein [Candidatus Hydrothermales bacterium]
MSLKSLTENKVFLVAEAGDNHNGSVEIAIYLCDLAKKAGCDAVKFQTFVTEEVILEGTEKASYQIGRDESKDMFEMVKKLELTFDDFKKIKKYCDKIGIIFFSTPYDIKSAEFLNEIGVPFFKISSTDLDNFFLLEKVAEFKKPIIISTGMSDLSEVKKTYDFLRKKKVEEIAILQCTSNYPAPFEELNLKVIETYKKEFPEAIVGFSDHSEGLLAGSIALSLGARILEKHFTLWKGLPGPDHKASLSPEELFEWVKNIRLVERMLGDGIKKITESEKEIKKVARRSIYLKRDKKKGEIITKEDITVLRPVKGITPDRIYEVIGKKLRKDKKRFEPIYEEDIE